MALKRNALCMVLVLLVATGSLALGDSRAGVDYHKGRVIVSFVPRVADRIDMFLEGQGTLRDVCGDNSLQDLFSQFGVTELKRFLWHDDWIIKNRGNRTPAEAYWDHVQSVYDRFPARRARAPKWVKHIATYGIFVLYFPDNRDVFQAVNAFHTNPHVSYAEPQTILRLDYTPDDTLWSTLWGHVKINCQSAWDSASGWINSPTPGHATVVAVLDTGMRLTHEDLTNKKWINTDGTGGDNDDDDGNGFDDDVNGYDFASGDDDPSPNHWHGTHCAGTIGAEDNAVGIIGIAYDCDVMVCKVFGSGGPYPDPVAEALNYATNNGADVTSNSYGAMGYSGTSRGTLINNAVAAGCIPIFSAGNDNFDGAIHYPSSYFGAFGIAASGSSDAKAGFSCYGMQCDVTAPGVGIRSCMTGSDSDYGDSSGTSMSGPHVAGAMAVFISYLDNQSITHTTEQIRQVLRMASADVDGPGWSVNSAYGRLDLNAMISFPNLADVCEARISSPDYLTPVSGSTLSILGTAQHPTTPASFSGYSLEYAYGKAHLDDDRWETIVTSTTAVAGGSLGQLSLSSLPDGRYSLRLTVTNTHGQVFRDRIEFVLDSYSDDSSSSAVLIYPSPIRANTLSVVPRNYRPNGETDWIKMELISGEAYTFWTKNLYGYTDTEIFLYNSSLTLLDSCDDYPSPGLKESKIPWPSGSLPTPWTCPSTGTYYLASRPWNGVNYPGIYDLHVIGLLRDAYEQDDSSGTAKAHALNQPAVHSLQPAGDDDYASFAAVNGTTYEVSCSSMGSATRVRLYGTNGSALLDTATQNSDGYWTLTFNCTSSGTYFVRVDSSSSATGDYMLTIYEYEDVFFQEDFSTVGDQLWTAGPGAWGITSGEYRQTTVSDGNQHLSFPDIPERATFIVDGTVSYTNVFATADATVGFVLRYEAADSFIEGRIRDNNTVEIVREYQGHTQVLDSSTLTIAPNTAYHLRLVFDSGLIHFFVNGRLRAAAQDLFYAGTLGLRSMASEGRFDDVKVFWYGSTPPLTLSSGSLPDGEFMEAYSQVIPHSGGSSPYTFTLLSGSLPPGLAMASDGTVSGTPTLLGSYPFEVTLEDNAQRLTARGITIDVYDTLGPAVTINNPVDLDVLATPNHTLSVDVTDHSAIQTVEYRINSGTWTALTHSSGDNYTASITLPLGVDDIDVRASDDQGNSTTEPIQVTYDPTVPQISITSHSDGDVSFSSSVTVSGTSVNALTVTVNGQPATLNGTTGDWSVDLTLAFGANAVTAEATDQYARTDQDSITLHYRVRGDVDGDADVDQTDVTLAAQVEAGLHTLTAIEALCADVDQNGVVDIRDAFAIRRKAAGFPIWTD